MSRIADVAQGTVMLSRTRSIADAVACTPPFAVCEMLGRQRSERFCTALHTLRGLLGQPVNPVIATTTAPTESENSAHVHGAAAPWTSCHTVAAALVDLQCTLDFLTSKAASTSAAVRSAVVSAAMNVLLDGSRCAHFLEAVSTSVSAAHGLEVMARVMDVMLWVVDAVCSPLAEELREDGLPCPSPGSFTASVKLWCELARHTDALLRFACDALASTSTGECRWGAPVHAGAVRMLDALLQTCFVLRAFPQSTSANSNIEKLEDAQAAVLAAIQLGSRLASEEVLCCVAAQLQMPVQVLDEVDGFTRQSHEFVHDVLRHGMPPPPPPPPLNCAASRGRSPEETGVFAVTARTPWMQLDSTRRPLSPVELYTCAVAFISHAAAYGAAFPLRLDGKLSVCVSVWEACVAVLERALQEGETALTAPPSSSPAPVEDGTAPVDPIPSMASTAFLSPLLPRIHAFTGARCEIAALAPQEETVVDSEPVSPCESPVMNTQATTHDRASGPLGGPAATTTATTSAATAEDAGRWRPAGTVTSSRRSMDFPPCPAASAEVETARSACGGEDSMRSNDVTMAGMTDTETASLCAESAVLDVIGRSRPIAIAPAKAISVMTSASQGNTSSALCGATPSTLVRAARTSSPSSATGSLTHSSVVHRGSAAAPAASAGGAQGLSTPSPRPSSLRKSAVSPSTAVPAHPRQPSLIDPLRFVSDGSGKSLHHGSSKSSCLQRERPSKPTATTTPTTTAFVCPALTLRRTFPSHPQLTNAVLTSLALLSTPSVCAVEAMMALADTRVLTVLSELMEHPGNTLQGVVMATVENCFAFWEVMLSLRSPFLFPVEAPAVQKCSVEASEALALPAALRACLHTFALFLRWDGESWAAVHAQYVQRALRLLIGVLTSVQEAAPAGGEMRGLCSPRLRRSPAAAPLLAQVVRCLLEHGVIAHIWRCLSMDATQVPGAMGNAANAPSNGKSGGGNNTGMRGGHPVPRVPAAMLDPASYGCFLYGAPPPVSYALLSEAQCTAIHLLYTLTNSLSWSSAKLHESPSRPLTDEKGCPVPDVATYCAFMEESFKHLPACANCLRRCTYTCSQSRPIVPADHEALSRVLNVLRILFGAMGARATRAVREDDAGNDDDAAAAAVAELRQTWAHQIEDSQVLDVLAHIGTAAELVTFTLPRLCIFTLRSFLCHVHHLTNGPLVGDKGSVFPHNPPSASASVTSLRHTPTTAIASTTAVTRARVGMAALQALVVDPPPPPTIAGASTWGRSAVRESLLVILLARMQRRCAGQSATASVPQRLEVFALLIDVLASVADSLPTALSDTSREACQQMYDAATAVELVRVTQRVVAAVLACRVWSGTAQELRYLDPSCTTPVKEALRFSARVAQLVNGSLRALLCVEPTREKGSARSGQRLTVDDSLGKHTACVLLAESTSVTFAFHVVTMDFPLALAGLMNGTRWQVAAAKPAGQPASCTSPNAGGSSSGRSSSNNSSSSSRGQASLASPTRRPATATMAPPRPPPSFLMAREADTNEFTNEDRRETCEVAASALVEILCVLGRVEALVQSATPLHPAVLAALPYRTGAQAAPSAGASGVRAMAARTAAASSSSSQTDEPRQYDVVVVQNGRADFAGVITSTVYPRAAAALAGPLLVPSSGQFLASATPSPDTEAAAAAATDGAGGPTSSALTTSPSAEATKEDPLNWRRTESQWRRRLPLLSTSVKDALQALDLEVLDRYLTLRHRRARLFDGAAGSPLSQHGDAESRVAEGAVMCLAAEKKRYLRSI